MAKRHTDGGGKRPRQDTFIDRPSQSWRDDHPAAKKLRSSGLSASRSVKDDGHGKHKRTATHPPHGWEEDVDWWPPHSGSKRQLQKSPNVWPRERGHYRRSHTNDDRTSSPSSRRRHYHDRPPRLKSQLPVGGATSSSSSPWRREVVPYTSSEAISGSRAGGSSGDHHSTQTEQATFQIPSVRDSTFSPSLPEKYYRLNSDNVSTFEISVAGLQLPVEIDVPH